MVTAQPTSKWGIRVGHYIDGSGTDTASHNLLILGPIIRNYDCRTFKQMLIVNQQDYKVVRPYFEGNTNSLAYELMLYINNRNAIVDSPHFTNSSAHSIGMMESDGVIVRNITAANTGNFKLMMIINTANALIDGFHARNTQSSPTAQNGTVDCRKSIAVAQIAGNFAGTDYTLNQSRIQRRNVIVENSSVPFNLGVDNTANLLKDWDFDNIQIRSWSGTNTGAYQLRGYITTPSQMSAFHFRNSMVKPSSGRGSFAAIRAIGMTVDLIEGCDFGGTFASYGALSTANGGAIARTLNNGGLSPSKLANDIEITDATKGVIGKSPTGTRWRETQNDDGSATRTAL